MVFLLSSMFKIQDPLTGILILPLQAVSLAFDLCSFGLLFKVLKQFSGIILA